MAKDKTICGAEYILAVNCGHNASAAIMRNGEIIAASQEERFNGRKNYIGYPARSIDFCLRFAGIFGKDLSQVAYTTRSYPGVLIKAQHRTSFTIEDFFRYYGEGYYGTIHIGKSPLGYLKWLRDSANFQHKTPFDFSYLSDEVLEDPLADTEFFQKEQVRILSEQLGIAPEKIIFLDHHTCHANYAYFGSPFRGEDAIVIVIDGNGDGRNQTVWQVSEDRLRLIAQSDQCDLGRIFKLITLLLGMRPDEHEYKVMGLAPNAKKEKVMHSFKVVDKLLRVDDMRVCHGLWPEENIFDYLKAGFQGHRFDNMAAAGQQFVENIVCTLVADIAKKTGIRKFVLGGGISMNVKMNKAIGELAEVESIYVCESGGDESLPIGGCYFLNGGGAPLKSMHLGYDIGAEAAGYDWSAMVTEFSVRQGIGAPIVARLLAQGKIVARVNGRTEFGARALGNRSILADPRNRRVVKQINEAVKKRDWWMPFALSILEERTAEYLINPKGLKSPFMSLAFDVSPPKVDHIEAGLHLMDNTTRPQFVSRDTDPAYHNLIEAFGRLTGVPAILNTSLNLHGEPMVNDLSGAVRTFKLSALDYLWVQDDVLISKEPI